MANGPALDVIERMARTEALPPTLCFNGDFNWFNVDDREFVQINLRVLANDAILGNVEAERRAPGDDAGCGCAYPDGVDDTLVERSNRIHRRLKATASRHPAVRARIAQLPMFARYRVGACRVGVVHGDADSLAGWRLDVDALDDPLAQPWLRCAFEQAEVDLFASTHTCLPAMRRVANGPQAEGWVVNNGAAGRPNFERDLAGLCTRISSTRSPHPVLHEIRVAGAFVALLPVRFDVDRWRREFLAQWPAGSPAWASYHQRRCAMKGIVGQMQPAFNMDDVHRRTLDEALEAFELQGFDAAERERIWRTWHALDTWRDFPAALAALRRSLPVVSFTMLPTSLVVDVSRRNAVVWDAVTSCEMVGVYKPHPQSYATAARWMGLAPPQILMVACHNFDLNAAKQAGYRTAFVRRPDEWGPQGPPDPNPNMEYDFVEHGFESLAAKLLPPS